MNEELYSLNSQYWKILLIERERRVFGLPLQEMAAVW